MKKIIRWNPEKGKQIRANASRGGIGFEECAVAIEEGQILDIIQNPSSNHTEQQTYVLPIEGYVYLVPFVENDDEIFLKTLYPSRKHKAIYLDKETP